MDIQRKNQRINKEDHFREVTEMIGIVKGGAFATHFPMRATIAKNLAMEMDNHNVEGKRLRRIRRNSQNKRIYERVERV